MNWVQPAPQGGLFIGLTIVHIAFLEVFGAMVNAVLAT